jgi:hypothetical protein
MLKALSDGEQAEKDFAEAKKKTDPAGHKALAAMLKGRMAWDELAALLSADVKASPSSEGYAELAKTYASMGRADDERATIEKALGLFKDAKERTAWRIRLATMEHDPSKATSREEFLSLGEKTAKDLEGLLAKLEAEKDAGGAGGVRAALGGTLLQIGKADDAEKQFDAALASDPKGPVAPTALMGKANCAWSRKDWAGCKSMLEKIVAEFPDSEEAKNAPRGIANCEGKLAKQNK